MNRFKNILAVVDTTAPAQDGLRRAVELARHNDAKLKIVDVVREFSWLKHMASSKYQELEAKVAEEKRCRLLALADAAWDRGPDPSTKVLRGRASTEIIREVMREGHDLVMKEAKGETGHKGFFGTTGMQLLRKCPCPVWITNPGPHEKYERVMAAVDAVTHDDAHTQLNTEILELAKSFCSLEGSRLDVVQVWSIYGENLVKSHASPEEFDEIVQSNQARVERLCNDMLLKVDMSVGDETVHLLRGEPGSLIPRFANEREIDLIMMGTVARSGIAGAVMGNTAELILGKVQCSVLALKPDDFVCPIQVEV